MTTDKINQVAYLHSERFMLSLF